jgi:hypothetical protein
VSAAADVTLRIDRLVVETDRPVDAFALRRALVAALESILVERGVPRAWGRDVLARSARIDAFAWDGQGGEPGLARALAARLYEEAVR